MEKKYQIFISSTYKDLIEARSKVRDAISCHIKMIPSLMGYILFRLEKENSK